MDKKLSLYGNKYPIFFVVPFQGGLFEAIKKAK